MRTDVISFYEEFNCIAGQCPFSCCKGWGIALDEDTCTRMKREPGIRGILLSLLMKKDKREGALMRRVAGRCPFLQLDGLCRLQKRGRQDLLADVCRLYPRRVICYGSRREVTLEMSCVHAAELFLQHPGRLRFVPLDQEMKPVWSIRNRDEEWLAFLMADREKILDYLWAKGDFAEKVKQIYRYVYVENAWLMRDHWREEEPLPLPLSGDRDMVGDWWECEAKELSVFLPRITPKDGLLGFFPIRFLNDLIYGYFSEQPLEVRNPFLHRMLRKYKAQFGDLREDEADVYFDSGMRALFAKEPGLELTFVSYFSYLLQQTYCQAYEDYYILSPVLLSLLHVEFVMLLFLVADRDGEELNRKTQAAIFANTERSLRHNLVLNERIRKKIREEFFHIPRRKAT